MVKDWFWGRLPQWFIQWVVLPGSWFTFFGSVWVAAHRFPGEYDWRYMVVSRLLSEDKNPQGYWLIALGTSLSGLMQIPLASFFYKRLRGTSLWGAKLGWVFMILGLAAMILMGVIPYHLSFFSRAHDMLALAAFMGLVFSVVVNTVLVVQQGLFRATGKDSMMSWGLISFMVMVLIPIAGTSLTQLYLYLFSRGLGWVNLSWRDRGVPVVLSIAFWEWLTCVLLVVYLILLFRLTCRIKYKI